MTRFLLLTILCSFWLNANTQCVYLAYDGFMYEAAMPLNGLSGSTGWQSPWEVQNNNTTLPGFQIINNSLSYNTLQTAGNAASGGRDYLTAGRRINTSSTGPFSAYVTNGSDGIGTARGQTLWISFILRKEQNNDTPVFSDFHNSNIGWCYNCAFHHIAAGYFGSPSNISGQRRWTLRLNDEYYDTGIQLQSGQNYLMVMQINFQENGTTVSLYVNPTELGATGPPAPTISGFTSSLNMIRSAAIYLGNSSGNGQTDELRMATSYQCAVPDDGVVVNLPPVAAFSMTPPTGQAPLSVTLDGTASFDPEGGTLSYQWNFGDGSPAVFSPVASHTFNDLGIIPVALTVIDNLGLQHTLYQNITILDSNNSFPCQASVTCMQMASCNNNDARIRINGSNLNFTLLNAQLNAIPATNTNEFHNLSQGRYHLQVTGNNNACTENFDIYIRTDSTTCVGWSPSECAMDIGTNMSSFADWAVERPMKNLFKHIRSEIVTYTNDCNCWNLNAMDQIMKDASGYPLEIPQTTSYGATMVRFILSADGGNLRADSTYVLLYDGTGSFSFGGGVSIISTMANRVVFSPTNNGNIFINISFSQPGNHLRNFRLLRLQDEFADLENNPFSATFLDKIAPFSLLRYMDWGETNNSPVIHWADRGHPDFFTYSGHGGVPYEIMIQLANQTQTDVWICVPHMASENYITQMAALFRDQLHSNLKIYLEYSNEVWNWIFTQAHYNNNNRPSNLNYGRAMAAKAGNVFRIWHDIFGEERCRVKRVLGIQGGFNSLNEQILSQLRQDEWDYGSPTHYFGLDHGSSGNPVLTEFSTVQDIMTNAQNAWNNFKSSVKQDYNNIMVLGKDVITYEGGQHFVGNVFGIPYGYQNEMWQAQYSPEMYVMYDRMHDTIRAWGCKLATNFSLASLQESRYGSWGVLSDINVQPPFMETAPKYQALIDNMPASTCKHINEWKGKKSHSWSDPCNWDKSAIPDAHTTVVIPADAPYFPQVDINAHANSVRLSIGASLWILTGNQLLIHEE